MASTSSNLTACSNELEDCISSRIDFLDSVLPQLDRRRLPRFPDDGLLAACVLQPQRIKQRIAIAVTSIADDIANIATLFQVVLDVLGLPVQISSVPVNAVWLTNAIAEHEECLDQAKKKCVFNPKDKINRQLRDVVAQMWWTLTKHLTMDVRGAPLSERIFGALGAFLKTLAGSRYEMLVLAAYHIAVDLAECVCLRRVQVAVVGSNPSLLQLLDAMLVAGDMDAIYERAFASPSFNAFLVRYAHAMRICIPAHDAHFGNAKNLRMLRHLLEVHLPDATLAALDVCDVLQRAELQHIARTPDGIELDVKLRFATMMAREDATALRALRIITEHSALPHGVFKKLLQRFVHVAATQADNAGEWGAVVGAALTGMDVPQQLRTVFHVISAFSSVTNHSTAGCVMAIRYLNTLNVLEQRALLRILLYEDSFDAHEMALLAALFCHGVADSDASSSYAFADDFLTKLPDIVERVRTNATAIYWLFRTLATLIRHATSQLYAKMANAVELALQLLASTDMQMARAWPMLIECVVAADRQMESQSQRARIHHEFEKIIDVYLLENAAADQTRALTSLTKIREFVKHGVWVDSLRHLRIWTPGETSDEVTELLIECYGFKLTMEISRAWEAPSDEIDANALFTCATEFWFALDMLFIAQPTHREHICYAMALFAGTFDTLRSKCNARLAAAIMPPFWQRWSSETDVLVYLQRTCFTDAPVDDSATQMSLAKRSKLVQVAFRLFWRCSDKMATFVRHALRTFYMYGDVFQRELKTAARCVQQYSDVVLETLRTAAADDICLLAEFLLCFMTADERSECLQRIRDASIPDIANGPFDLTKTIAKLRKKKPLGAILSTIYNDFTK